MPDALIAIDQGTTSTRAIVFNTALAPLASAQQELRQIYPAPGEVEHDPEEIWNAVVVTVREAMAKAKRCRKGYRRHRHQQPARDDGDLGACDR